MTQPVQEPNPQRDISGLGWGERQLARRPASAAAAATASVPWIAVYDNFFWGQPINTSSSGDNLEYPYIDWSSDAGGIFSYTAAAYSFGSPGMHTYNPKLLIKGLYLFSWMEEVPSPQKFQYGVQYNLPIGSYPGGTSNHRWEDFRIDTDEIFSEIPYKWIESVMVPVATTNLTVYPFIMVRRPAASADFDLTFNNWLWIGYLGPLNNDDVFNASHRNDPYPTTP